MAITALANLSDANAGWGTISYNGFTFGGLRDVKIVGDPVYDESGRAVSFVRYTITIHGFQVDSSDANHKTTMVSMRRSLMDSAGVLVCSGQGVGDIQVNTGDGYYSDCDQGPKPVSLELTQVGGITTEYTWTCNFAVPEHATIGRFSAFNYTIDWSYDDAGIATRMITGYFRIHRTQVVVGRTIAFSADAYRDQIRVLTPPGFRRTDRKFTLSQDRMRLDFTISDVQLQAEAPPAGALRAELDYEVENIAPGFARYGATLSGYIETPVGTPTIVAAEAFVKIMLDKIAKLKKLGDSVVPLRIRLGRTLGTRRSFFSFTCAVNGCMKDIITDGGIWEPLTHENYQEWAQSMSVAWSNRGNSNLFYSPSDDAIIDLGWTGGLPTIGQGGGVELPPASKASHVFKVDVNESSSWMAYENTLEARRSYRTVVHNLAATTGRVTGGGPSGPGVRLTGVVAQPANGAVLQEQGPPEDYILMHGKGMRIKYKPEIPKLLTIGGKRVEEVKVRTDGPKAVGCVFGVTIYTARWAILYRVVDGYLGDIPTKKNLANCCDEPEDGESQT